MPGSSGFDAVSSIAFGAIESTVSDLEEFFNRDVVRGHPTTNANTERQFAGRQMRPGNSQVDCASHLFGNLHCSVMASGREHNRELIAAIPRNQIAGALDMCRKLFRYFFEILVAFEVAELVIEVFEGVHIDKEDREALLRPQRPFPFG